MKLSKEETAFVLISLGYEISRDWKLKLRDERTASASINPKTGKIKDFGSGWSGSVVDLLVESHGYSLHDALSYVEKQLKLPCKVDFSKFEKGADKEYKEGFISENYILKFAEERKANFSRFWGLITQTMPTISNERRKDIVLRYSIGYSKASDRIIMPIRDEFGNILTLWKYNRFPKPFKGVTRKVLFTKDRRRCPFALQDMLEYRQNLDEYILLMEGEKDCLNALASGYRALTLGSATQRIEEQHLHLFKDVKIAICYDFDEAGKKGAEMIREQLKGIAKNVYILDWEKHIKSKGLNIKLSKGFDFTDYLVALKQK